MNAGLTSLRDSGPDHRQFHLIRDGVVTGLMADPSAVDPRQIPEDEIRSSLARMLLAACEEMKEMGAS